MTNFYIIAFIIVYIIIAFFWGVKSLSDEKNYYLERWSFSKEYFDNYMELINGISKGKYSTNYHSYLILNARKMQNELGAYGFMVWREPFMTYDNYPVIVNEIPKLSIDSNFQILNQIQSLLLMHLGQLDDVIKNYEKHTIIDYISEGHRKIISIPLMFLQAISLLTSATVEKISKSMPYKFMAFIAIVITGILSFSGNLVTTISGYDQTKKVLLNKTYKILDTTKVKVNSNPDTIIKNTKK